MFGAINIDDNQEKEKNSEQEQPLQKRQRTEVLSSFSRNNINEATATKNGSRSRVDNSVHYINLNEEIDEDDLI